MLAEGTHPSEGQGNALGERVPCGHEVLNQPVGRVQLGEDPIVAIKRITLDQTGLEVEPLNLIGPYFWLLSNGDTVVRYNFSCKVVSEEDSPRPGSADYTLEWLSVEQLEGMRDKWRNPATRKAFEDHFAGRSRSLDDIELLGCWTD